MPRAPSWTAAARSVLAGTTPTRCSVSRRTTRTACRAARKLSSGPGPPIRTCSISTWSSSAPRRAEDRQRGGGAKAPSPVDLTRHLLHGFLGAAAHLVGRDVFLVGGETPVVAEGIDQLAEAVSPEHVGGRHERLSAGFHPPASRRGRIGK